ncbi:MAG: D-alanyl-D-alanine carboxypeptidase family protein, partial [Clostridia bacterium]|nr:D-alanyl-D-alanine carboxypeptidase family protein [Clostridia bacterium]
MNNNRKPNDPRQNPPQRPVQGQYPPQGQRPAQGIARQTPANRRAEPQKIKLTAEQIEINRVNRQRERYRIKKRRRTAVRTFFYRFIVFLLLFALMAGMLAAALFLSLNKKEDTDSSGWSYDIGGDRYSLSYTEAVRDDRVYVSFTDVAEMLDLAVTGSMEDIKYIIKGAETETIRFKSGTREVFVNNVETRLASDCFYRDDELYVPVDFVDAYFKGLNVDIDERGHKITITREITNLVNGKVPKGEEAVYAEPSFLLQSPAPMAGIDEAEAVDATMPDLGFVTSIEIYEEYMNPGNTADYLILVNADNRLDATHVPQDLMAVSATRDDGRAEQLMRTYAAMALEALYKELRAAGFEDVSVTSAYRSYSYQESVFNSYIANEKAKDPTLSQDELRAKVMTYSMPAGASEHQTGLSADMHNLPTADKEFGKTDAFRWLKENCWKFGFILRFPEDKTAITGVDYEPWHYRYVGRYHAQRIMSMNMCLEEYIE